MPQLSVHQPFNAHTCGMTGRRLKAPKVYQRLEIPVTGRPKRNSVLQKHVRMCATLALTKGELDRGGVLVCPTDRMVRGTMCVIRNAGVHAGPPTAIDEFRPAIFAVAGPEGSRPYDSFADQVSRVSERVSLCVVCCFSPLLAPQATPWSLATDLSAPEAVVEKIVREWYQWRPHVTYLPDSPWRDKCKLWEDQEAQSQAKLSKKPKKRKKLDHW